MDLSIVVPVFNEQRNVSILYHRINQILETLGHTSEIIFVNDGSQDRTLSELQKLQNITIINFRRNFGQTAALDAGFKQAKGNVIITMDGDLQNDPADIPLLLSKLNDGYDVVSGWRFNRKDKFEKRIMSWIADKIRRRLIGGRIHDSGCSLKAYKKECLENIDLYGEMHRYIPALLQLRGFKVGEVKVRHHPRRYGRSKYSFSRIIKGFLDLINVWFWMKFDGRPLHLFGGLGVIFGLLGTLGAAFAMYQKLFNNQDLSSNFLAVASMLLFVVGINFLISGLMADIALKTFHKQHGMNYYIKEIIET